MDEPDLYMTANDMQRRDASDFSDEYCDEIGEMSGLCIDIGSGPGDVAVDIILPKLDPEATLVCSDISETMLDSGRKKYKDNDRMAFMKLDIESPDLPKDQIEQYDHATSFYCLHWCQDMRQVFKNIYNLLRPGGSAFLIFMASDPGFNAYKILANEPRYEPYMKDVRRYIPAFQNTERQRETLKTLLKDVGFNVHHCSCRERSWIFSNREILTRTTIAVNPFIARIPNHLKDDYKKDLIKEIENQKIIFNKNNNNEDEYSILSRYFVFIVYMKKPSQAK